MSGKWKDRNSIGDDREADMQLNRGTGSLASRWQKKVMGE